MHCAQLPRDRISLSPIREIFTESTHHTFIPDKDKQKPAQWHLHGHMWWADICAHPLRCTDLQNGHLYHAKGLTATLKPCWMNQAAGYKCTATFLPCPVLGTQRGPWLSLSHINQVVKWRDERPGTLAHLGWCHMYPSRSSGQNEIWVKRSGSPDCKHPRARKENCPFCPPPQGTSPHRAAKQTLGCHPLISHRPDGDIWGSGRPPGHEAYLLMLWTHTELGYFQP